MSKHTKGPWKCNPIDRAGNFSIIPPNAGNGTVVSTDEALANAKLIAAAPEMLEVLKLVWRTQGHILGDYLRLAITDAINKAGGRDHE